MNISEIVAIFALLSAFLWGITDFFGAKAAKSIGPLVSMQLIAFLNLFFFLIFYLLSNHSFKFSEPAVVYALLAGLFFGLAGILFFKGLQKGPVSLVSPIASVYHLITTLIALLIFHAKLTFVSLIGIILIVLGMLAASGILSLDSKNRKMTDGVKLAIATAFFGEWLLSFWPNLSR